MFFDKLSNSFVKKNLVSILSRQNFLKTANICTSTCLFKKKHQKRIHLQYEPRLKPESKMLIRKKNAMVIGGTSGIGLETAHWLLVAGCNHVIVAGKDEDKCKDASYILRHCFGNGRASSVCVDVRDPKQYEEALMYSVDKVNNLEILVNCYGMMNGLKWEDEICLNVNCLIRGTLLAYDFMGTDSTGFGGIIINVAGTMGLEPMSGAPSFAASKHAVVGFSRSYGSTNTEAETNVRLVTLCPGYTRTNLWENTNEKAMRFREWELEKNLIVAKKQMPQVCGKSILYLAKYADTGSVWVIEGSELYELDFPQRKCYSRHAQTFS